MSINSHSPQSAKLLEIHLSPGSDEIFKPASLPVDADGFIVAFHVDQEAEMLAFFEKHGVVAVSNVLTEQECERSVDDLWTFLQEMFNPNIERDKPET
jgi:hypothetical protein